MFLLHSMSDLNSLLGHGQGASGEPSAWRPLGEIAAHSPFLLVNGALSSDAGLQGLPRQVS